MTLPLTQIIKICSQKTYPIKIWVSNEDCPFYMEKYVKINVLYDQMTNFNSRKEIWLPKNLSFDDNILFVKKVFPKTRKYY